MGDVIVDLVPVALGVILSPLAIMALIAVLLSPLARVNGVAYLLGWTVGLTGLLAAFLALFTALQVHTVREPPLWVAVLRLLLGLGLVAASVWVYRRGAARVRALAAARSPQEVVDAVPTLPGWLQQVSRFRPGRCFALGLGMFALNPVDISCAVIAALDLVIADLDPGPTAALGIGFAVVGVLPMAVPVAFVAFGGARAQQRMGAVRTWIAGNTHVVNAALLLVIGVLQLNKGVGALV